MVRVYSLIWSLWEKIEAKNLLHILRDRNNVCVYAASTGLLQYRGVTSSPGQVQDGVQRKGQVTREEHHGFPNFSLCSRMTATRRHHQRGFFVQWLAVDAEAHNWSVSREEPPVGFLATQETHGPLLLPQRLGDNRGGRSGKTGRT